MSITPATTPSGYMPSGRPLAGVEIVDKPDVSSDAFEIKQPYLTEQIILAVNIEDGKRSERHTHIGKPLLTKDNDGEERKNT